MTFIELVICYKIYFGFEADEELAVLQPANIVYIRNLKSIFV